jgi:DNA-binding response OmpR family regulator
MKVLLIEDAKVMAELVKTGLSEAGFTVDVARDGESGLRMATAGVYALIILDLMLPKRDGRSICTAIRARPDPLPF